MMGLELYLDVYNCGSQQRHVTVTGLRKTRILQRNFYIIYNGITVKLHIETYLQEVFTSSLEQHVSVFL